MAYGTPKTELLCWGKKGGDSKSIQIIPFRGEISLIILINCNNALQNLLQFKGGYTMGKIRKEGEGRSELASQKI